MGFGRYVVNIRKLPQLRMCWMWTPSSGSFYLWNESMAKRVQELRLVLSYEQDLNFAFLGVQAMRPD